MKPGGKLGGEALIGGAGIGGLAAAAALSPLFETVTVCEKDRLPAGPEPRNGVVQGHHVHAFLIGGLQSLERLLPGIIEDFRAAGAHPVELGSGLEMFDYGRPRPKRPLDRFMLCLSRPAYELALRRRVAALPNVRIESGVRTAGIAFADGRAIGLALPDGSTRRGDLVVDATGRCASLVERLRELGYGETSEAVLGIDMCYASGRFRLAERWADHAAAICVPTPPDKRYGVLLPIEDGQCVVTLGGRCGVEPPTDREGFIEYARQMASPSLHARIIDAELLGPIRRYRKPTATWRRYDRLSRFPGRLAPVGDTIASFNPTWGQGMTVAVRHALALRDALLETGLDDGFAPVYLPAAAAKSEEAWTTAALVDLAYPEVTGERPPNFEQMLAYQQGLRLLADQDADVHRLWIEAVQMARSAAELRDPALAARVLGALTDARSASQPTIEARPLPS